MRHLLVLTALLFAFPAHAQVTIQWVTVGDPWNPCDVQPEQGCFGTVRYTYQIGKYEVTNDQYADFLNAVAATTDPYALYSTNMADTAWPHHGGITRSGEPGDYQYTAIAGRENKPVNWITVYDAMRFANWMHNGQGNASTETGAYTLLGGTPTPSNGTTVTRNAGATIFLPSEDEWYKAAYYSGSVIYYDYPAGWDNDTTCATPGTTANTANCAKVVDNSTNVGSYTGAASPYGTFDQGGNVWEWNELIFGTFRGHRGGGYGLGSDAGDLAASYRGVSTGSSYAYGFRVANRSYPVPSLGPVGLLLVAAGLLGFGAYRRGRA